MHHLCVLKIKRAVFHHLPPCRNAFIDLLRGLLDQPAVAIGPQLELRIAPLQSHLRESHLVHETIANVQVKVLAINKSGLEHVLLVSKIGSWCM